MDVPLPVRSSVLHPGLRLWWPVLLVLLAALVLSSAQLGSHTIDDLDSAHNIMDGIFFHDLLVHPPLHQPMQYALEYYKQYPALGFVYWPPFYPLVESAFFIVGGVNPVSARLCLLLFVLLLAVLTYRVAAQQWSRWFGVAAVLLLFITPSIHLYASMILLEIPALAMSLLAIVAWQRLVRGDLLWKNLLLFVLAAAAAVYTKQTVVFLLPVFLLDLVVNHRVLLRDRRIWMAAGLLMLALAPLAVFTLTIGKIGIAQSLGSDKSAVLSAPVPPDRWSIAGWTYYLRVLPSLIGIPNLLLGLAALLYGCANRSFLKRNLLWFGWVIAWFLLFSVFLNKQPRYATLWIPGWTMLAVALAHQVAAKPRWGKLTAAVLLVLGIGWNLPATLAAQNRGYDGMETITARLLQDQPEGNILYLGNFHQAFVPFVRMMDKTGKVHVLLGEKLLRSPSDTPEVCGNYRARSIILVSPPTEDPAQGYRAVLDANPDLFRLEQTASLGTPQASVPVLVYGYRGEIASQTAQIPLHLPH